MMGNDIFTKADWTLFRQKVPIWQEAYMGRLLEEYRVLISSDKTPSQQFWALEQRLRQDKRKIGVTIDMERSKFFFNLSSLLYEGVITLNDLEGFSEAVKERMKEVCYR